MGILSLLIKYIIDMVSGKSLLIIFDKETSMRKSKNFRKMSLAVLPLMTLSLFAGPVINSGAYGETSEKSSLTDATQETASYEQWKDNVWTGKASVNSANIMLTPGENESDLNFAWYSTSQATPAVEVSDNVTMKNAIRFIGNSTSINRSNGTNTYRSSDKVSVNGYFKENSVYYYCYTDDINAANVVWSSAYRYEVGSSDEFTAILVGDPQIGASGSTGEGTADDINIAVDTYNWNKTLGEMKIIAPKASFILSAGDQINYSQADENDTKGVRESEYAGFTYPSVLRSLPVAATVGNHESMGSDYKYHFNNPDSQDNLGATNSGCDYYFSYGDVLFISLNSNNRNSAEHEELMKKAIASNTAAKWRIVMFHHDIYGSGEPHSDVDGANLRTIFAPLMDEFDIDLCLNGHDHTYSRSYLMSDGTAIDYGSSVALNPEGTLYITAGSASGSKFYNLNKTKQYYIAERTNCQFPSFSTIEFSDDSIVIRTYDYNGNKYADDFTLYKTQKNEDIKELTDRALTLDKKDYTKTTWKKLNKALKKAEKLMRFTGNDEGKNKLVTVYDKNVNADNKNDYLDYYGYAYEAYANEAGTARLKSGFSALLDKTENDNVIISKKEYERVRDNLSSAIGGLKPKTKQ
jgi:hypothetical protein